MATKKLENVRDKLLEQKNILHRQISEYKEAIAVETDSDLKAYFEIIAVDKVSLYGQVKSELKTVIKAIEQANRVADVVGASLIIDRGVESERLRFKERSEYKKSLF